MKGWQRNGTHPADQVLRERKRQTWRWGWSSGSIRAGASVFIKPDDDGPDVFVHVNAVKRAGYSDLLEGARVSYELVTGRNGKQSAENLRIG